MSSNQNWYWNSIPDSSPILAFSEADQAKYYQVTESFYHFWLGLQRQIETYEDRAKFVQDPWISSMGSGCTSVLTGGDLWEKMGVAMSCVGSNTLPEAALEKRKDLTGLPWLASGVSVVFHPKHPKVPTVHLNVRFFLANKPVQSEGEQPNWWFGGGFDLTPWHPNNEDCRFWHQSIKTALDQHSHDYYPAFKQHCDEYFWLPHRNRMRGIGGIFYDNLNTGGFQHCNAVTQSVAEQFSRSYLPIAEQNAKLSYTEGDIDCQLVGRARYAEFNLMYDRGTKFGLQSNGRVESILVSMPPRASWHYRPQLTALEQQYLPFYQPFDWVNLTLV